MHKYANSSSVLCVSPGVKLGWFLSTELEQVRGCKLIVNCLNEDIFGTLSTKETVLFCLVLASFSEGEGRLARLDQGALKVLLRVGRVAVVGSVVGGWEGRPLG